MQLPIDYDLDWYQIIKLNDNDLEDILKNNFLNYGYTGWQSYVLSSSIGTQNPYLINGYVNKIKVNLKEKSNINNKIAIFLYLTEKKLILYYGITYRI